MSKLIEAYENLIAIQAKEIAALKELAAAHKEQIEAFQELIKNMETQLYMLKHGKLPPPSN